MSSAAPVRAGTAFWIWALFVYFGGLKPYGFRVNHGPLGLSRVQCTVHLSAPALRLYRKAALRGSCVIMLLIKNIHTQITHVLYCALKYSSGYSKV